MLNIPLKVNGDPVKARIVDPKVGADFMAITYRIQAKQRKEDRIACGYGATQAEMLADAVEKIKSLGHSVEN
jgi:hypothetical protein